MTIDEAIADVVDKAKSVQAENGPDGDYRRYAEEELACSVTRLKSLIAAKKLAPYAI